MRLIGLEARIRNRVLGAIVTKTGLRERLLDDVDGVLEDSEVVGGIVGIRPRIEVQALEAVVSSSHAELKAPVTELVQKRDVLGEPQRMPERDDRRREPNPDPLSASRQIGGHEQWIGQHLTTPDAEVVLGEPEVVESGLLAEPCELAYLVQDVPIVALVPDVPGVAEIAELHEAALDERIVVRSEGGGTMLLAGRTVKERPKPAESFHAMAPVPGRPDQRSVIRLERLGPMSGCASGQPDLQRGMALPEIPAHSLESPRPCLATSCVRTVADIAAHPTVPASGFGS